jgi:hypothetical protein
MPRVDRTEAMIGDVKASFQQFGILEKIQQVCVFFSSAVLVFIPVAIVEAISGKRKANVGRLKTVIKGQIYQQSYGVGASNNATVFMSKKKDALLIHTAPEITAAFVKDIQTLGAPVKYIYICNQFHEEFASDCKAAFPEAKVLAPKPCKDVIAECCPVDGTVEEHLEALEDEFGFTKMFKADDNVRCGCDRSHIVELYGDDDDGGGGGDDDLHNGKNILFVGQCGYGNFRRFDFGILALFGTLAGFNGGCWKNEK